MKRSIALLLAFIAVSVFGQTLAPRQITGREDTILAKVRAMGLPVVEINTVNREFPHYYSIDAPEGCYGHSITGATKVPGRVTISLGDSLMFDSGEYEEDVSGMRVNIRGNYTARMPKKPYKVKLEKKNDMLRRGDARFYDKNWLLLTTQDIKADVGSKVAEMLGMPFVAAFEHVNLIFNGEYKGNYLLMESVRRNTDCRINISKDGYIFEYDPYYWNEDVAVPSSIIQSYSQYTFKYPDPDEITEEQIALFTDMIYKVENSLLDGTYPAYVDVGSFAAWVLANDLLGTNDWAGCNKFMTKYDNTEATKLQMPCLWDFDSVVPDTTTWFSNYWFYKHEGFFFDFLFNNPNQAFLKEYVRLYDELAPTFFDEMDAWLEDLRHSGLAQPMEQAIVLDSIRWKEARKPFDESIEYAHKWFAWRKKWIDQHIVEYRQMIIPTGIDVVLEGRDIFGEGNAPVYNLQGQRFSRPQKGINIRNRRKVVVRDNR